MGWSETRQLSRSIACSGDQLRLFRAKAGWTQEQLADISGYSDRLIRKAEAGGSLHPDTIEILAEALSDCGAIVHPEDLIISPREIALAWGSAYREKGNQLTTVYQHSLADDVEFFMAGDPDEIPFAGNWKGIDGFDRVWQTYFHAFDRVERESYLPKCTSDAKTAVTLGRARAYIRGTDILADSWVCMRFEFERGRVTRIEDYFDTKLTADLFTQAFHLNEDRVSASDDETLGN